MHYVAGMTTKTLRPPRIRFNWGFHDGSADAERDKFQPGGILTPDRPHFDKLYEQGYRAGHESFRLNGKRAATSDAAWKVRCTCKRPFGWHTEGCKAQGES